MPEVKVLAKALAEDNIVSLMAHIFFASQLSHTFATSQKVYKQIKAKKCKHGHQLRNVSTRRQSVDLRHDLPVNKV